MKKSGFVLAALMLSACSGGGLFDGPDCDCHKPVVVHRPCPQRIIYVQPVAQKSLHLAGVVYFANASDYLNEGDKAELNRIARYVKANPVPVKVMGHASHKVLKEAWNRKDIINMDISKKRTQKVANTLASMGVSPSLISATAYSDSHPAEIEIDAKSEALNRRVEIYLEY
jgi:outer membrane protein OmpA-like peptidoglycan-associated protein